MAYVLQVARMVLQTLGRSSAGVSSSFKAKKAVNAELIRGGVWDVAFLVDDAATWVVVLTIENFNRNYAARAVSTSGSYVGQNRCTIAGSKYESPCMAVKTGRCSRCSNHTCYRPVYRCTFCQQFPDGEHGSGVYEPGAVAFHTAALRLCVPDGAGRLLGNRGGGVAGLGNALQGVLDATAASAGGVTDFVISVYAQNMVAVEEGRHNAPADAHEDREEFMKYFRLIDSAQLDTNRVVDLLEFLRRLRSHPVLGPHMDRYVTWLLSDYKVYKGLVRACHDPQLDQVLLRSVFPCGTVLALGCGLHFTKILAEYIWKVIRGVWSAIFPHYTKRGKFLEGAKLSVILSVTTVAYRSYEAWRPVLERLLDPVDGAPTHPGGLALAYLMEHLLPLLFLQVATFQLAASTEEPVRVAAFKTFHDSVLPAMGATMLHLGSLEYANTMLHFAGQLSFWRDNVPELYSQVSRHPRSILQEEPIELAHAEVCALVETSRTNSFTPEGNSPISPHLVAGITLIHPFRLS